MLRSLSPRSSGERATASGAVSAGSNPAGGTGQRHKFEHSANSPLAWLRACDLQQPRAVPDRTPDTCPDPLQMNKSLLLRPTGIHGLRAVRSHQAVDPAPKLRLCGGSGHDPPSAGMGHTPGRQVELAPSAFCATSATGELGIVVCRTSHPARESAVLDGSTVEHGLSGGCAVPGDLRGSGQAAGRPAALQQAQCAWFRRRLANGADRAPSRRYGRARSLTAAASSDA